MTWVRKRRAIWSHVRVAGIGLRDGDHWQNVWSSIVLVDEPKTPLPSGAPVHVDSDVCVFRDTLPIAVLPALICDLKRGEFSPGRFGSIERFVLRCPNVEVDGKPPSGQRPEPSGHPYLLTAIRREAAPEAPEQWTRVELEFRTGPLSEHFGQSFYRKLEEIDERLTSSIGSLNDLGRKLGLKEQNGHVNEVWTHPATVRLSAPIPLRLEDGAAWDEKRKRVVARVRVGRLIDRASAVLAIHDPVAPALQKSWTLPRTRGRAITVILPAKRPSPHSVLRLAYLQQQVSERPLAQGGVMGIERTLRVLDLDRDAEKDNDVAKEDTTWGGWVPGQRLGAGGQGEAWLATKRGFDGVAVLKKALPGEAKNTERRLERLRREADALRTLRDLSPFIVRLVDSSSAEDPLPWLVTEFAPLRSVEDHAAIYKGDVWRTLRLARDVASGLGVAHEKRLIHRDIKPANLLLFGPDAVKITDFGIGHDPDRTSLTTTGERVRTRWFSPPEAERGEEPTFAWDVFMLGRTIYHLLSGGKEYPNFDLRAAGWNLVEVLDRPEMEAVNVLLDRMVAPDKTSRFQSIGNVVAQIDRAASRLFGARGADQCRFCGDGTYSYVGRLRLLHPNTNIERPNGQPLYLDPLDLGIWSCPNCGSAIARFKTPLAIP
jgi:tRNA A-37 threonylcarbamoyl transferase component Bud32